MNCPRCGCKKLANENTRGVWSCGTKSWPYCSDVIESVQCLRNQLAAMTAERDAARAERDTLKAACDEFMVWYDRDGSVGGLDNLMFDWRRKVQPEFFTDWATQEAEKGAEE